MKKTSLARRNSLLAGRGISIGVIALIVAIVLIGARLAAPDTFYNTLAPLIQASEKSMDASRAFFGSFSDAARLQSENDTLREVNAKLANHNRALAARLSDLGALVDGEGVVAGVLAHPPQSPYDTLLVSVERGSAIPGMAAFADITPIGTVSWVTDDYARITLLTAPGVETPAWAGASSTALTLRGAGAGAFNALVAQSVGITVGDIIYVAGPGRLPVGRVTSIDADQGAPGATLRITPLVNLFSLTWIELRSGLTLITDNVDTQPSTAP